MNGMVQVSGIDREAHSGQQRQEALEVSPQPIVRGRVIPVGDPGLTRKMTNSC